MAVSKQAQVGGFIAWLAICFIAAAIGAVASVQAGSFYLSLSRPEWAPPASVFGPVWTALYTLMAIAAWLVWRQGGYSNARAALNLFLAQLALNALWSWLFFAWHLGAAAFVDILLLLTLLIATMLAFWRQRQLAALLLVPYLLWVSFAAVLNYTVWQMNPDVLGR
ncbi:TspO/MBR family protein [Peristeroidobacter agariperforans]|uniref:TspO/MBR family protein n=1 Tax=Peristeroidobacter agariperforans TaxID=268404 RepID=UPI00101DF68E|nr:TspO/MBR family protein [Peristeroidobacter agariperforans]